jgi:hypothetical protein
MWAKKEDFKDYISKLKKSLNSKKQNAREFVNRILENNARGK